MNLKRKNKQSGFTLVEIMVVIAIIGMLTNLILTGLGVARSKGRDAKRKADLKQMQTALDLYYNTYNAYPSTGGSTVFYGLSASVAGNCAGGTCTSSGASGWIPNLAPEFISQLPNDPLARTTDFSGYLYASDGVNYKLIAHSIGPESWPEDGEPFYDPARYHLAWMVTNNYTVTSSW